MRSSENRRQARQLILRAVKKTETLAELTLSEWDLLIRCLRVSKLLAYIGNRLAGLRLIDQLPEQVQAHFDAARQLADYRKQLVLWELNRVNQALAELGKDIVVLKGGAYLLLNLEFSNGRLLSDLDLLVAKDDIEAIEQTLIKAGWETTQDDKYNQHYYRTWMHEIPALRHPDRFVEVDVHHSILPLSSRLKPDSNLLLNSSILVNNRNHKVLAPCDMVLHSSVHLFYDAELKVGDFRDLVDLHELLTHYSAKIDDFWRVLLSRAQLLDLERPLYYALFFTKTLFDTDVPQNILAEYPGKPDYLSRKLMAFLAPLGLMPEHPDFPEKKVSFIRWLLYIRSHYLRMPLNLLIPHLWKKAQMRLSAE